MFKFVHMCRSQRDSLYPPEGIIDEITAVRDQTKLQYKRKQRLPSELHEQREATRSPHHKMSDSRKGPGKLRESSGKSHVRASMLPSFQPARLQHVARAIRVLKPRFNEAYLEC